MSVRKGVRPKRALQHVAWIEVIYVLAKADAKNRKGSRCMTQGDDYESRTSQYIKGPRDRLSCYTGAN